MFEVTKQGAVFLFSGDEPVDNQHIEELARVIEPLFNGGQPLAVLDLQAVPLLDSEGLEFLLDALERVEQHGGLLKLAGANALCADILRVTGVGARFEMHATARDAIRSFSR